MEKETPEITQRLLTLFDGFLSIYEPANDFPDSSEWLTTEEIVERMKSNYPFDDLTPESVYSMLDKEDFKFLPLGDKYVWVLKKK